VVREPISQRRRRRRQTYTDTVKRSVEVGSELCRSYVDKNGDRPTALEVLTAVILKRSVQAGSVTKALFSKALQLCILFEYVSLITVKESSEIKEFFFAIARNCRELTCSITVIYKYIYKVNLSL
jgi:hypothetical protein